MKSDLREFLTDYIKSKHWTMREYCRDTERVLGPGNGLVVTTVAWMLQSKNPRQAAPKTLEKLAKYHGLSMTTMLEMAGYLGPMEDHSMVPQLLQAKEQIKQLQETIDQLLARAT